MPVCSLLDGFSALVEYSDGLKLLDLASHDAVRLRTVNSEYYIVVVDPTAGDVRVQGGLFFTEPTDATLRGSSCGGAMIRVGWIGIGLQLELAYQPAPGLTESVVTSIIESIDIERADSQDG